MHESSPNIARDEDLVDAESPRGSRIHRDYIAVHEPRASDRLLDRIQDHVARLEHHPHIGRTGRVEGTRELVIFGSPYIVAYRIEPDRIDIMAVVHGARRWLEKF